MINFLRRYGWALIAIAVSFIGPRLVARIAGWPLAYTLTGFAAVFVFALIFALLAQVALGGPDG